MMIRLAPILFFLTLLLSACESTDGMHILTTAAGGTEIMAERVVARMLDKPAGRLIYSSADIDRSLQRMRVRWPQLAAELARGSIGLTDDGMLRIRQAEGRIAELKMLVRLENFDRQMLYRGICAEVGYGDGRVFHWLPFTEDTFGKEWVRQAPAGWWHADAEGRWQRKVADVQR